MEYINNTEIQFKGILRRFKTPLTYLSVFVLESLSLLNNGYKQKSIINIMLTTKKTKI